MNYHVIKYQYKDGKKLNVPILWCDRMGENRGHYFKDIHLVTVSNSEEISACKSCIRAAIKALKMRL